MLVLLALSYFVIPALLIRFYRSRDVILTFENRDPRAYRIEKMPMPILVLEHVLKVMLCCTFTGKRPDPARDVGA